MREGGERRGGEEGRGGEGAEVGNGRNERATSAQRKTQQVTLLAVTKALSRGQSQGQGGGSGGSVQNPQELQSTLPRTLLEGLHPCPQCPTLEAGWGGGGGQAPPTQAAGVWTSSRCGSTEFSQSGCRPIPQFLAGKRASVL